MFQKGGLDHLLRLRDVCRRLRLKRLSDGALELSSNEIRFKMAATQEVETLGTSSPTCLPIANVLAGVVSKSEIEINRVVAEAMILANALVAEKITSVFPTRALLRRHPVPSSSNFRTLARLADILGHSLETGSNAALAASLDAMADAQPNPVAGSLIKSMAVTAMTEAEYFCTGEYGVDDWYHYGLALPRYTHFTSPIRRYADILVHRALMALCSPEAKQHVVAEEGTPDVIENTLIIIE